MTLRAPAGLRPAPRRHGVPMPQRPTRPDRRPTGARGDGTTVRWRRTHPARRTESGVAALVVTGPNGRSRTEERPARRAWCVRHRMGGACSWDRPAARSVHARTAARWRDWRTPGAGGCRGRGRLGMPGWNARTRDPAGRRGVSPSRTRPDWRGVSTPPPVAAGQATRRSASPDGRRASVAARWGSTRLELRAGSRGQARMHRPDGPPRRGRRVRTAAGGRPRGGPRGACRSEGRPCAWTTPERQRGRTRWRTDRPRRMGRARGRTRARNPVACWSGDAVCRPGDMGRRAPAIRACRRMG